MRLPLLRSWTALLSLSLVAACSSSPTCPSQPGRVFCAAYDGAGSQCDDSGASYPESTCLEAAKSYEDSALKAANDCLGKPCAELSACLSQAIPEVTLPQ